MQNRNNLKKKSHLYIVNDAKYVNTRQIAWIIISICQKDENLCIWVEYLINVVLSQFQICQNLCIFFRQIYIPKISEFTKKMFSLGPALAQAESWY